MSITRWSISCMTGFPRRQRRKLKKTSANWLRRKWRRSASTHDAQSSEETIMAVFTDCEAFLLGRNCQRYQRVRNNTYLFYFFLKSIAIVCWGDGCIMRSWMALYTTWLKSHVPHKTEPQLLSSYWIPNVNSVQLQIVWSSVTTGWQLRNQKYGPRMTVAMAWGFPLETDKLKAHPYQEQLNTNGTHSHIGIWTRYQ